MCAEKTKVVGPLALSVDAESDFAAYAEQQGWEVCQNGWPDFLCVTSDGEGLLAVEVKSSSAQHLSKAQKAMILLLQEHGIRVRVWTPDRGLEDTERWLTPRRMGRPTLEGARRETFCFNVTQAEIDALEAAAATTGKAARVWARDVLLRAAKRATG